MSDYLDPWEMLRAMLRPTPFVVEPEIDESMSHIILGEN